MLYKPKPIFSLKNPGYATDINRSREPYPCTAYTDNHAHIYIYIQYNMYPYIIR